MDNYWYSFICSYLLDIKRQVMGKLIVKHQGKSHEYLINTMLKDNVIDKIVEDILKWFPSDAEVDFIELW